MKKVWNFSAGPSTLPDSVLQEAKEELTSYKGSGISVMEMSHRSTDFTDILDEAKETLRELLHLPQEYSILFLQGGASLQFAMVPLNLKNKGKAVYIDTGDWSKKAQDEAVRTGMETDRITSSGKGDYLDIFNLFKDGDQLKGYDYVHITANNTIKGTQFHDFPETGETPLVADMSSDILSRPLDIEKFGLIYAGAQKNLGIAGLTLVIIRNDLLNKNPGLPKILNYQTQAAKGSTYNTPPTFAVYISGLLFKWIKKLGGLEKMEELNRVKAEKLYLHIDNSQMFEASVPPQYRSLMNVPFATGNAAFDEEFITFCEKRQIINIKGHRSAGGMRASIYNAMPLEGVEALIEAMEEFEKEKGVIQHG